MIFFDIRVNYGVAICTGTQKKHIVEQKVFPLHALSIRGAGIDVGIKEDCCYSIRQEDYAQRLNPRLLI